MTSFPPSPPVNPGQIDFEPEPPSWPKVIGIISIVWGSLGVFCNACGMLGSVMGDMFVNMVPPEQQAQMKAQMQQNGPAQMVQYGFGLLAAVFLIVAGVQLVQRKGVARMLHLIYGGLGVLMTIVATVIGIGAVDAQLQQMTANPQTSGQAGMMKGMMYGGLAFGVVLGLAYPVFLLIWFGLIKKNAQDITQGVRQDFI